MVGKRVLFEVDSDLTVGPFENRKKFVTGFLPDEDIETFSRRGGTSAQSSYPYGGIEFSECSLQGFDANDFMKLF